MRQYRWPIRYRRRFPAAVCRQNCASWRRIDKSYVGVPVVIVRRIVVVSIQHNDLLDIFSVRINGMNMQIAKSRGERPLLMRRDRLIAQKQHLMANQRMIELFKLCIAQRPGQIDITDLRTDVRA